MKHEKELQESVALVKFYKDLCNALPVDDLLPLLVTHRVITIPNKDSIMSGKTSSERTQFLLDHFISKSLSAGDTHAFYKLLEAMQTLSECNSLAERINQFLSSSKEKDENSSGESYNDCYKIAVFNEIFVTMPLQPFSQVAINKKHLLTIRNLCN